MQPLVQRTTVMRCLLGISAVLGIGLGVSIAWQQWLFVGLQAVAAIWVAGSYHALGAISDDEFTKRMQE